MLRLYNTLTRKKEVFKPIKKGEVGVYSCGPTVYWYQHIGNLRTYIFSDMLKRTLMFDGFNVRHVMNVTDVGHLTSDADTGEDKMERAAEREGKKAKDIAAHYLKLFRDDFNRLNIIEPTIWSKATDNIKEQIDFIKKLENRGYIYKTGDGIYFDTSKLKDYGKLAKLRKEDIKAGKRISLREKRNNTDFALWKFSEEPGKRQQEWDSPWGIGFPGWHLECSAMSMKYLGERFDIHTGGMDHIQIHHTNEIAQSEALTGKKFVNYWLHGAWLLFKGEKVSKSKGGLYTISELEKQGYSALSFRYLVLTTHYRKPLNFTLENLKTAQTSYHRLKNIISELNNDKKINKEYLEKFQKEINDDLNTPGSLQVLWNFLRDEKAEGKIETIKKIDEVLGLDLLKIEKIEIPNKIKKLVSEREKARKEKDWKKADELRDKINKEGYTIDDTKEGTKVKKHGNKV
ncbi:MAG: cysteine--tRNA ligase [Nanoarchaeota archaeon]|nr:cysteine--tRNA ligase [Nanoarchaeota archaeon]